MTNYTKKDKIVYKNQFHVIWCPKYRRPVLVNGIDNRLKEILYEVADSHEVIIKSLEVMPDHVHIVIEFDPRRVLHKIIKDMKGVSSHILREEYPELKRKLPTLWSRSYFSCTVGHVSESTVRKYIETQKEKR